MTWIQVSELFEDGLIRSAFSFFLSPLFFGLTQSKTFFFYNRLKKKRLLLLTFFFYQTKKNKTTKKIKKKKKRVMIDAKDTCNNLIETPVIVLSSQCVKVSRSVPKSNTKENYGYKTEVEYSWLLQWKIAFPLADGSGKIIVTTMDNNRPYYTKTACKSDSTSVPRSTCFYNQRDPAYVYWKKPDWRVPMWILVACKKKKQTTFLSFFF